MASGDRREQLPEGVEVLAFGADGEVRVSDRTGSRPLDGLLRFLDRGQGAHYLVGDARSSPERPSTATYKIGVVAPHSAFTPHAHGGEHFVLSLGRASCGLVHPESGAVVRLRLGPATMVRIPAMLPHSFGNRDRSPLLILAANTGHGIDHEDYAITSAEAARRGDTALADALRALDDAGPDLAVGRRERFADLLRRTAERVGGR